ncbi:hypothetical protein DL240_14250 [Lujinxingia litoralis]|uniref:Uncharacterized protein n=1 Tax=Lujinxingia litoralis TaxID=2211119 RepID=A0A328C3D9_9DELT|nr:hypothetical protein [Lujinxingia litoralis]RAL21281.1 hypothetical protein DL240_14250 [Lujinxingia litoralis]
MRHLPLLLIALLTCAACGVDDPSLDCGVDDSREICQVDAGDDLDAGDQPDADADEQPDADADDQPDADEQPDADADEQPDADADEQPDADADDQPDADADEQPDADADDQPDADLTPGTVTIELDWTASTPETLAYSDLDLYYCPEGVSSLEDERCVYWNNDIQEWGPGTDNIATWWNDAMDIGEVEDIEHEAPANGRYHLGVQAYWDRLETSDPVGTIEARVRIKVDGTLVYTGNRTFDVSESMWYLGTLSWPELAAGGGAGVDEAGPCEASGANSCVGDGLYEVMYYLN